MVPAGNDITIDMNIFNGIDVDLALFDDAGVCGNQVAASGTTTAFETVTFSNITAAPVTVTLQVFLFSGTCADYDLTATVVPTTNPCFGLPADTEEDNDDCLSAVRSERQPARYAQRLQVRRGLVHPDRPRW